jgi:hypothetical protein
MKKITKSILGAFVGIAILFATTAFIISDPQADFAKQNVNLDDQIALSQITTKNLENGFFKSSVKFKQNNFDSPTKEFYGQAINIADNPQVDKILIGVTNNLISRIEIWNRNNLIETKELGFMDKMTWGETQTMAIDFYDHTNEKYKGKSEISMHFYSRTGFFGDIGTLNFDLTKYGDLSGNKSIGVFARTVDGNTINEPEFSNLRVWKNYKSFD